MLLEKFGRKQWDRFVGNLSYPIYLVQILVGGMLATAHISFGFVVAISSIPVAVLLDLFIDNPIDYYRSSMKGIAQKASSLCLSAQAKVGHGTFLF